MGGKAGINAALQQITRQFEVIPVHVGLPRKGDRGGFEIRSFAQADADFGGAQLLDIRLAAVEVALNDHADRAMPGMQRVHQVERAVGILAGFHIDADEVAELCGAADQLFHVGQALVVGKIEAELREFERHAALDAVFVDRVEGPQVGVAGFAGFIQGVRHFRQGRRE